MLEGIRGVDKLGRIVLPSEIRKAFNIRPKEMLHVSYNGKEIVITRQDKLCVFCRSNEVSGELGGKYICKNCFDNLSKNANLLLTNDKKCDIPIA